MRGGLLIPRPDSGLLGATAQIQPDGSFSLADTAENQDVVAGTYQVFVTFPSADQSKLRKLVHKRHQESEDGDSEVFVTIDESTEQLAIKLKK